jgi:predicted DNA binding protein
MNTVVDLRIPAQEFALAQSLADNPRAGFEIGRAIATTSEDSISFLWGSGMDLDGIFESLQDDPTVAEVEVISKFDDEYLFKIQWATSVQVLFKTLLNREDSALLDAYSSGSEWKLRLVYPCTECFDAVEQECGDLGRDFEVERVYSLAEAFAPDRFHLTEKQYETVMAAYDAGYYDIPRKIKLKELARQLGISHQALSERLRRAHEELTLNGLGKDFGGPIGTESASERQVDGPPLAQAEYE